MQGRGGVRGRGGLRARGGRGRGRGLFSRGGRGGVRVNSEPLDQAMEDALNAMTSPERDEVCCKLIIEFAFLLKISFSSFDVFFLGFIILRGITRVLSYQQ